jgi:hypothetical protein
MTEIIKGTEAAILLTISDIDGFNARQFDWKVELYTNPNRRVSVNWDDCTPVNLEDPTKFYVPLDSSELGVGEVTADIIAYIPDGLFKDGLRTEIVRIESIATIIP